MSSPLKRNYNNLRADHILSIVGPDAAVVSEVPGLGRVKKKNIIQGYPEEY
jgi:hypothetical protein